MLSHWNDKLQFSIGIQSGLYVAVFKETAVNTINHYEQTWAYVGRQQM